MLWSRGGVWEIRSDTALALPWHIHPVLPKTATRKLQGDPGSAVPWPTVCSKALLSREPSQQGLPGLPPGAMEGTPCGSRWSSLGGSENAEG